VTARTVAGFGGLIVILWRAGLRIQEALALTEADSISAAARCSSAAARADADARGRHECSTRQAASTYGTPTLSRTRSSGGWQERALRAGELCSAPARRTNPRTEETKSTAGSIS
jgi:hypothetical protein